MKKKNILKCFSLILAFSCFFLENCDVKMVTEQTLTYRATWYQITNNNRTLHNPAWSPDGSMIAFSQEYNPMIFKKFSVNGNNLGIHCWLEDKIYEKPALSSDGTKIVYRSQRDGQLYFFSITDSSYHRVTTDQSDCRQPCWSPDGNYIAYVSYVNTDDTYHLSTISIDGQDTRQITFGDSVIYMAIRVGRPMVKKLPFERTLKNAMISG